MDNKTLIENYLVEEYFGNSIIRFKNGHNIEVGISTQYHTLTLIQCYKVEDFHDVLFSLSFF